MGRSVALRPVETAVLAAGHGVGECLHPMKKIEYSLRQVPPYPMLHEDSSEFAPPDNRNTATEAQQTIAAGMRHRDARL
jgi:hypothetical protein